MALDIDANLLKDLGLASLPPQDQNNLLAQIYETLEMRVGLTLARQMSDEQLKEFEKFVDTNDEAGAVKWLEEHFPQYKQVVHDELAKLKEEIKQNSTEILEEMKKAQAEAQGTQQPPAPDPNQTPQQ